MHGIRRKSLDDALRRSSINQVQDNSNSLVPDTDPEDDIESSKNDLLRYMRAVASPNFFR
jgi:hypothetical protein